MSRTCSILAIYLIAAAIISLCLGPAIDSGMRTPLNIFQLTFCAAAGPLYLITASTTGLTDTRYALVGPLVGATCFLLWLATVLSILTLRRVPLPLHLLAAVAWLFLGVMLLIATGTK